MNHAPNHKNKTITKATLVQRPAPELNVAKAHFGYEVRRRIPWMLFSVAVGILMVLLGESYEKVLSRKIQLVFFVPMLVYMSDSIGTETLALFVRELALRRLNIGHLFLKESLVGLFLGLASGIPLGLFSYFWFRDAALAMTVAIAMTVNGVIAVQVGMLIPFLFAKFGKDPAIGSDEITTALSDNLSLLVYLVVAVLILFGAS